LDFKLTRGNKNDLFCFCFSNSYLGFDHAATLFHIRDSPADPVERPIYLTNTFSFAILIHDVLLPEEAKTMFKVCLGTLILLIVLIYQPNDADTLFFSLPSLPRFTTSANQS